MSNAIAVYPGCFTPPTYGHFHIAQKAAEIFEEVTIVCSTNKEKNETRWFSEEECKLLWQHYPLSQNVSVRTFTEQMEIHKDYSKIIMIRGIRDEEDMENEKRVMKLNKELFGIDKLFYILADDALACISASKAREAAQVFDFQTLASCVSPAIVTSLLEKVLAAKNLFMVVGRPGSGKSTFLKRLSEIDDANVHINTDLFSQKIKPLILERFGEQTDLVTLAIQHDKELTDFIAPLWFHYLADALQKVPKNAHVFVEIPYGLKPGKDLYRYIGHKVIYIGCEDPSENRRRIMQRNTSRHLRFIDEIPDLTQSIRIARQNNLKMFVVNSGGGYDQLQKHVDDFQKILDHKKESSHAKTI